MVLFSRIDLTERLKEVYEPKKEFRS